MGVETLAEVPRRRLGHLLVEREADIVAFLEEFPELQPDPALQQILTLMDKLARQCLAGQCLEPYIWEQAHHTQRFIAKMADPGA